MTVLKSWKVLKRLSENCADLYDTSLGFGYEKEYKEKLQDIYIDVILLKRLLLQYETGLEPAKEEKE